MKIIGLDLSTKSGVAVIDEHAAILHTELVTFPKLRDEPRISAIAGRIMDVIAEHTPELIVLEDYAVGRFAGAAIVNISLGSVVRFILWQQGLKFVVVSPTSVKKFLTGKGNAKKENMILEVYKKYGFTSATNDEADAIALGMMGLCSKAPSLFTKASVEVAYAAINTKEEPMHPKK